MKIKTPVRSRSLGVTIAIPNWNHELLLPRSLETALTALKDLRRQGVEAEILVIDDASRDGSLTLLRQLETLFFEEGLRVLARTQNARLGAARNLALHHARYRYVMFLDADDELVAENLHTFYRAICDTGAALVYGNLIVWQPDGVQSVVSHESFRPKIFTSNHIGATILCDREQVLDCGGYQTEPLVHGLEDWELNLHLATQGRLLVFVPAVLSIYHKLPNSLLAEANQRDDAINGRIYRIFNQLRARAHVPHNTLHLHYHPDIGYL